jgi:hypothetical protein
MNGSSLSASAVPMQIALEEIDRRPARHRCHHWAIGENPQSATLIRFVYTG